MRVRGDKENLTLKDRLKIDTSGLESCQVFILRDCLDQTQLNIKLPGKIQREWVDRLAEKDDAIWINGSMFMIDKPYHYRLMGVVGRSKLNVRFRITSVNPNAWVHLRAIISDIIRE